jgi:hypothetical protein
MAKTYTQILTQSNLQIPKLFYNSNNSFFFSYNPIVFWLFGFAILYTYMYYYWPLKGRLQTLKMILWVLLMLVFIKEKNLERYLLHIGKINCRNNHSL